MVKRVFEMPPHVRASGWIAATGSGPSACSKLSR
jgi:hypothetical protein